MLQSPKTIYYQASQKKKTFLKKKHIFIHQKLVVLEAQIFIIMHFFFYYLRWNLAFIYGRIVLSARFKIIYENTLLIFINIILLQQMNIYRQTKVTF